MCIKRLIALASISILAGAQTATPGVITCKSAAIGQQNLQVDGLKLTFANFKSNWGGTFFTIHIENSSNEFQPFSYEDIIVVGSDGNQQIPYESFSAKDTIEVHSVQFRIAPSAYIDRKFNFKHKTKLPAKIYFKTKLVIMVSD